MHKKYLTPKAFCWVTIMKIDGSMMTLNSYVFLLSLVHFCVLQYKYIYSYMTWICTLKSFSMIVVIYVTVMTEVECTLSYENHRTKKWYYFFLSYFYSLKIFHFINCILYVLLLLLPDLPYFLPIQLYAIYFSFSLSKGEQNINRQKPHV